MVSVLLAHGAHVDAQDLVSDFGFRDNDLFICHLILNICICFDRVYGLPYIMPVGMATRM